MAKRSTIIPAAQIERFRQARGLSVEELAAKADMSTRNLQRLMAGKPAYMRSVRALAAALGVTPNELLHPKQESATKIVHKVLIYGDGRIDQLSCRAYILLDVTDLLILGNMQDSDFKPKPYPPSQDINHYLRWGQATYEVSFHYNQWLFSIFKKVYELGEVLWCSFDPTNSKHIFDSTNPIPELQRYIYRPHNHHPTPLTDVEEQIIRQIVAAYKKQESQ